MAENSSHPFHGLKLTQEANILKRGGRPAGRYSVTMQQPTIDTRRLILRPFKKSDAGDVQVLAGDRLIADTTLRIPHPYTDIMAEKWISKHPTQFKAGEAVIFAIILRKTGALIGAIGLGLQTAYQRAELGFWTGRPFWNRGYCQEAGHDVLAYGFLELGLNRIQGKHFKRNPASGRVMQKLGMVYEGCARQQVKKWDQFEDVVWYGILKAEWLRHRNLSGQGADRFL